MTYKLFRRNATEIPIPSDQFFFWATLCQENVVSTSDETFVLWCLPGKDVCFALYLLDSDNINNQCATGQWRLTIVGKNECRAQFLKEVDEKYFPAHHSPEWLTSLT
jgi:hypothetical protein